MKRTNIYRQPQASGVTYLYFRAKGHPLIRLPNEEDGAEFDAAYRAAVAQIKTSQGPLPLTVADDPPKARKIEPGTIAWFIIRYLDSDKFKRLAPKTQSGYRSYLEVMRDIIGPGLLHAMSPERVDVYSARIMRAHGNSVADAHVSLIGNLWEFAKGFVEFKRGDRVCPIIGASKHYEHDGTGHLAWPDPVIEAFDATADEALRRVRIGLHYTGQRGSDVVRMSWDDYDGERIFVTQQKTGEQVWITCPDPLKEMLDAMPRIHANIFTSQWGRPYASASSLSNCIKRHMRRIGQADYTMHGLRKNAGVELALAGCEVAEIMNVLGHRSPKMAMFYCAQADKLRLSKSATGKWNTFIKTKRQDNVARRRAQIRRV
jgi:integrase